MVGALENIMGGFALVSRLVSPSVESLPAEDVFRMDMIDSHGIVVDAQQDSRLSSPSTLNILDYNAVLPDTSNSQNKAKKSKKSGVKKDGPPKKFGDELVENLSFKLGAGGLKFGSDLGGTRFADPGYGGIILFAPAYDFGKYFTLYLNGSIENFEKFNKEQDWRFKYWADNYNIGANFNFTKLFTKSENPAFFMYLSAEAGIKEFEAIRKTISTYETLGHVGGHSTGYDGRQRVFNFGGGIGVTAMVSKHFGLNFEAKTHVFPGVDDLDALPRGLRNDATSQFTFSGIYFIGGKAGVYNKILDGSSLFIKNGVLMPFTDLGDNSNIISKGMDDGNGGQLGLGFDLPMVKSLHGRASFDAGWFNGENKDKDLKYSLWENKYLFGFTFNPAEFADHTTLFSPYILMNLGWMNFEAELRKISDNAQVNHIRGGDGFNDRANQFVGNYGVGTLINLPEENVYLGFEFDWTTMLDKKGNDRMEGYKPNSDANKHDDALASFNVILGFKFNGGKSDQQRLEEVIALDKAAADTTLYKVVPSAGDSLLPKSEIQGVALDTVQQDTSHLIIPVERPPLVIPDHSIVQPDSLHLITTVEKQPIMVPDTTKPAIVHPYTGKEISSMEGTVEIAGKEVGYQKYVVQPGDNQTSIIVKLNGFESQQTLMRQNEISANLTSILSNDEELKERILYKDGKGHEWVADKLVPGDTIFIINEKVGKKANETSSLDEKINQYNSFMIDQMSDNISDIDKTMASAYNTSGIWATLALEKSYKAEGIDANRFESLANAWHNGLVVKADKRILKNSGDLMGILYDFANIFYNSDTVKQARETIADSYRYVMMSDTTLSRYVKWYESLADFPGMTLSKSKEMMKELNVQEPLVQVPLQKTA